MSGTLNLMEGTARHSSVAPDAVEIWFTIEKDAEGCPESQDREELWATTLHGDAFRLDSTPFFASDIAAGDVVSAFKTEAGFCGFERVISRSGNSSFRIWLRDVVAHDAVKIVDALRELHCNVEITLKRLIAVNVPADREERVWQYLEAGRVLS